MHIHIGAGLQPELMFSVSAAKTMSAWAYPDVGTPETCLYASTNCKDFDGSLLPRGMASCCGKSIYDWRMAYFPMAASRNVRAGRISLRPRTGKQLAGRRFRDRTSRVTQRAAARRKRTDLRSRMIRCFPGHLTRTDAAHLGTRPSQHKDKIIASALDSSRSAFRHPSSRMSSRPRARRTKEFR